MNEASEPEAPEPETRTPDAYYMCVYLEDGEPSGHRGNWNGNFPATLDESIAASKQNKPKEDQRSRMEAVSEEFMSAMMGYLEYVPLILSMAPNFSHGMVSKSLQTFLERTFASIDRTADRVVYKVDLERYADIKRFQENLDAARSVSRALPRLLTIGLVTTLEYHVNLVMKEIASKFPERIFEKERTIPISKAVNYSSMEELKDAVINDEIDKAQRETFDAQIKWIIDKANMSDFTTKYPEWPKIIELLERRNLFVHANGIVNDHYLKAASKYGFAKAKTPKLGDELTAGAKYFSASVNDVIHFGAMLLQVVWRKISPDESEHADRAISGLGYELIARGRFKLAIRILEFAKNLRGVTEIRMRMNVVNLANAYKLSGKSEKASTILSEMDWTAVSVEFKISVAAIKGEVEQVCDFMKKIGKSGDVRAADYQQWPVFYGVRSDARFIETFKSVFGVEYVPSAKKQAGIHQVLEWIKDVPNDENPEAEEIYAPSASLQPVAEGPGEQAAGG